MKNGSCSTPIFCMHCFQPFLNHWLALNSPLIRTGCITFHFSFFTFHFIKDCLVGNQWLGPEREEQQVRKGYVVEQHSRPKTEMIGQKAHNQRSYGTTHDAGTKYPRKRTVVFGDGIHPKGKHDRPHYRGAEPHGDEGIEGDFGICSK